MTPAQVVALLERNKQERGIEHWKRLTGGRTGKSFGLGLTQLRKIAKGIGKDHDLAQKLWASDVYDAKVVGLLVDDPKKMTRAQAEKKVAHLGFWMMAHVYCSCDAAAAKTSFAREMAVEWAESEDKTKRRCGYLLLAELSKNKKDPELTDAFYGKYIDRIAKSIRKEENFVKDAMNAFIFAVGHRRREGVLADRGRLRRQQLRAGRRAEAPAGPAHQEEGRLRVKRLAGSWSVTRPPNGIQRRLRGSS